MVLSLAVTASVLSACANEPEHPFQGIYGFPAGTLKPALVSLKHFEEYNASWSAWMNPIKETQVLCLDDYMQARSSLVSHLQQIKTWRSEIATKTYMLGLIHPLKPELPGQLDECMDKLQSENPEDFVECNKKSKEMALSAIEKTFNDMDVLVRDMYAKRLEATKIAKNANDYENRNAEVKDELHVVAEKVQQNADHYDDTHERKDIPELTELARKMTENLKAKIMPVIVQQQPKEETTTNVA